MIVVVNKGIGRVKKARNKQKEEKESETVK